MRVKYTVSLCLLLILLQGRQGVSQRLLRINPEHPVICYQSASHRPDRIGVTENFQRLRASAGRVKTATFEVEYINFPDDNLARTAFQYAIEIWESELVSAIPIKVRAEWRDLDTGVLGQALWGSAYANFGGEQYMNTFYPVALAEKICGRELNHAGEPDIVASFNSKASWYLGTDGATPTGKMDLVTIVLHEIAHGLGFTDTYDVEDGEATVGLPSGSISVPFVFDVFVEDGSEKNLLQHFNPPSAELASALQSTNVFFDGALAAAALNGTRPELFAPATFDKGSSISHLDEAVFNDAQDPNRLMTPQIAFAESIHDPGNLLRGMLRDMGWTYTYIDHQPLNDTERKDGLPYIVTVLIRSDNGYDPGTVMLHYTTDGVNYTSVDMSPTGAPNQFQASLPGTTIDRAYAYYISVVDTDTRTFTHPGKIQEPGKSPEQGTHFFNIGPDFDSPVILHEPVTFVFDDATHLELTAEVTDNQGVKEVLLEYFVTGGSIQTAVMEVIPGRDEYMVSAPLPVLTIGDVISYRLVATDLAAVENLSTSPEEGFFEVAVTGSLPVQDSYVNDFNEASSDFFGNRFRITTPPGFDDGAIHSDHPYGNGTGPNNESNYTYQLQVPIRLRSDNPYMRFDEIVLVEPGEAGVEFGGSDFFDYVVVEGSSDGGSSWKAFAKGYDARDKDVWLSRYNSDMSNDDSGASGDPGLYRARTINMLSNGNFSAGDEVLVRFRLYADQLAHGWGWSIDNLSIQSPITHTIEPQSSSVMIYPVPVTEDLRVEIHTQTQPVSIQISDLQGKILFSWTGMGSNGMLQKSVDVRSFQNGVYIVQATAQGATYRRKFIKASK